MPSRHHDPTALLMLYSLTFDNPKLANMNYFFLQNKGAESTETQILARRAKQKSTKPQFKTLHYIVCTVASFTSRKISLARLTDARAPLAWCNEVGEKWGESFIIRGGSETIWFPFGGDMMLCDVGLVLDEPPPRLLGGKQPRENQRRFRCPWLSSSIAADHAAA